MRNNAGQAGVLMTLIRTGYPMYCAHFPGGDPRRFEPDPDSVTPAELAAWEAACRAADEQEGEAAGLDGSAFYERLGDVTVTGHVTMFGPGTYWYELDFMDEEDRAEAGGAEYADWTKGDDDGGGPETDRLIAEAMAAWRADVAWRIARRLEADGVTNNDDQFVVVATIMEELEKGGLNG